MNYMSDLSSGKFRAGGTYWIYDIKEGPVNVTTGSANGQALLAQLEYDVLDTENVVGTFTVQSYNIVPELSLVLSLDETSVEWVPTTELATMEEYRYRMKAIIHISLRSWSAFQQMVIWNETPTRRKVWRRVGSTIIVENNLPPSEVMRGVDIANPIGHGAHIMAIERGSATVLSRDLPSTTSTADLLDGSWFKVTRPSEPYLGCVVYNTNVINDQGSNVLAYVLLDVNVVSTDLAASDNIQYAFDAMQLEQVPGTGEWKIYINAFQGYLGTNVPGTNNERIYPMTQANNNGTVWSVDNLIWDLHFDAVAGTVQFENVGLRTAGIANRYIGSFDDSVDGTRAHLRMREESKSHHFNFGLLFVPDLYEYTRYNNSPPLIVECCTDNVTETGTPPIGYGTAVNYSVYCPSQYVPTTVGTYTSGACDTYIIDYCNLDEHKNEVVCSCIHPTDLPLLPSNATIVSYQPCFSVLCQNGGYVPLSQRNTLGQLDCPVETLCDTLATAEIEDNVEYNDAQTILDCTDAVPEETTSLSLFWISVISGGGLLLLIAIILIFWSLTKGKSKEEEKSTRKGTSTTRQRV